MKDIEQVPSVGAIHLIAIKDNRIFDLKRKVEEMQKTLEQYTVKHDVCCKHCGELTTIDNGTSARLTLQSLKEDKPNEHSQ